jgi:Right handed beta helix region
MRLSNIAASLIASSVVFLHAQPVMAATRFFSENGSGSSCSQASPCSLTQALVNAGGLELSCADSSDSSSATISVSVTIDCAGTTGSLNGITVTSGAVVTLRNFTMWSVPNPIVLQGGTVILENVHITVAGTGAIVAQPTSASTLIIKNCVFDTGAAGVVLKPSAGGSLSARFDHVTIVSNAGGGIKIDTTNGPVTVDITDSEISGNAGNGMNAVGGAGGPAMFNIHNSVIAKNGSAGVQVNGATAAAMIDTTLLDSNAAGATSVVSGGHILTYGNNRIVGTAGSGFTGSTPLQ